jgi:hypothetical protein
LDWLGSKCFPTDFGHMLESGFCGTLIIVAVRRIAIIDP